MSRFYEPFGEGERPPQHGDVTVTYLGATTLLFEDGETRLMVDGFFSRPSKLRTLLARVRTDEARVDAALRRLGLGRESLDALFVVHTHHDHALDAAYVARRTGAALYGSPSTLNVGRGGGLCEGQMYPFKVGREMHFGRFRVTALEAVHSPPHFLFDDVGEGVTRPLRQPALPSTFKEGGSFDLLIRYGPHTILVKPGASYEEGALDGVRADVLFLGTGRLGKQDSTFREAFYAHTVERVRPRTVIPIHWDDFTLPLTDSLQAPPTLFDDSPAALDFLIARTQQSNPAWGIELRFLQGYQRLTLFERHDERPGVRPRVDVRPDPCVKGPSDP